MLSNDDINCTPPELRERALDSVENLLPKKSRKIYKKAFEEFEKWCERNNAHTISENILLVYFQDESKKKKSSTLWSTYSMLRSCLNVYKNIDISKFQKLQALLRRLSEGYEPKKSKILEAEDIDKFIGTANDKLYLSLKIILIMGYNGACRREEITNMTVDDIEYKEGAIVVSVPKTKTNVPRIFAITNDLWINLIKKYAHLRPKHTSSRRFFLTYRNGYCINSPIGINTVGKAPKVIAAYLKLPNPELFTGHCFRRSSASHLANMGGNLVTIKQHGGWKSSTVAEGYIEASLKNKIEVAQILSSSSTSTSTSNNAPPQALVVDHSGEVNTNTVTENTNIQQNIVQQTLPGEGVAIRAEEGSNVTVNVYNNCTFHGDSHQKN